MADEKSDVNTKPGETKTNLTTNKYVVGLCIGLLVVGVGCLIYYLLIVVALDWVGKKLSDKTCYAYKDKIVNLPPIASAPIEWNDTKLIDLHIRTSHNTYISGRQHANATSTNAIIEALDLGARCIELDLGLKNGKWVVGHGVGNGTFTTSTLTFDEMIQVIADNAFKKVDDPLFIALEIYDRDPIAAEALYNTIMAKLGSSVYKDRYTIDDQLQRVPISFADLTLGQTRNKVLFFSKRFGNTQLDQLFEGPLTNMGTDDPNSRFLQPHGQMNRIFPAEWYSATSLNINAIPHMSNNFNLIGMNFGCYDKHLYEYLSAFDKYCVLPMKRV